MTEIRPQKGPQEKFLSSPADIVIYGGAAGGGKSYAILMEPLRHINNSRFGAVIFRKNSNQITNEGGLWDTSQEIYNNIVGAMGLKTPRPRWRFSSGARVTFSHLERDEDVHKWQGSQIALIEFDELTHFSQFQFFYMLSRNRSTCGVKPYVRATCNPDAESWVAEFIAWWWDPETGYPIPERSGVIRYMIRRDNQIHWGDTAKELWEQFDLQTKEERAAVKSVTFIASSLQDNKILMEADPGYYANLMALPIVEQERLLRGNWKIKAAKGLYFKRSQIPADGWLDEVPNDVVRWVRAWDLAATDTDEGGDPAYTAGVLIGRRKNGRYVVADVTNKRLKAAGVRDHIKSTAVMDKSKYKKVRVRLPQDPGQAGKDQAENFIKFLAGFSVVAERESGSKETRAEPFASQWQHGNVDIVKGEWNEMYIQQLEAFPEGKFKDMVDASSSAFAELTKMNVASPPPSTTSNSKTSYWLNK